MSIETTLTLALALVLFVVGVVIRFVVTRLYRLLRPARPPAEGTPVLYPKRPGSRVVRGFARVGTTVVSTVRTSGNAIYRFVVKGLVPLAEYAVATVFSWTWGVWSRRVLPIVRGEIQWVGDVLGQSMYAGVASANGALNGEDIGPFIHDGFGPTIEADPEPKPSPYTSRKIVNISSSLWELRTQTNGSHNGHTEATRPKDSPNGHAESKRSEPSHVG